LAFSHGSAIGSGYGIIDEEKFFFYFKSILIQKATSGVYKVLGDQARLHPDQIFGDPFTLAAKVEIGRYANPFVSERVNLFISLPTFSLLFIFSLLVMLVSFALLP
jgi:hypothetical protein